MGSTIQSAVGAIMIFGAIAWIAHRLAVRGWPDDGPAIRLCAAAGLAYVLMSLGGTALLSLRIFRADVVAGALLLSLLIAALTVRRRPRSHPEPTLRGDVAKLLRRCPRLLGAGSGIAVLLLLLILLARLVRGLAAPPLSWDALTYHLVKAGRWVQFGHWCPEAAPDAWGYYEYYPPNGDLIWAWAMLPTRTDLLLAPAGVAVWLSIVLGAGAACRSLGSNRRRALNVALCVSTFPAVINYLTTAYVENVSLALVLLAIPFLRRFLSFGRHSDGAMMLAMLATAAGVKVTSLPSLGLAVAWVAWRLTLSHRLRPSILAMCLAACLPCVHGYHRAWMERGQPLYPLTVSILGRTFLDGNPERALIHSARIAPGLEFNGWGFARTLLVPDIIDGREHLGLGPVAPLLLCAGLAGLLRLWRRGAHGRPRGEPPIGPVTHPHDARNPDGMPVPGTRVQRGLALAILLTSGLMVAAFCSEGERALRTLFALSAGRFLALPLVLVVLPLSLLPGRAGGVLISAALWVHAGLAIPLGWSREDIHALAGVLPVLAFIGLLIVMLAAWSLVPGPAQRMRAGVSLGAAMLALVCITPSIQACRDRHRYAIYAAAAEGRAYDAHELSREFASSWPIWQWFDAATGQARADGADRSSDAPWLASRADEHGVRIAITAGFDGIGHNWYRYPFLGSRLQNEVVYVTPIADGSVIDYRLSDEVIARADPRGWLKRLRDAGIRHVAALSPQGPEALWMTNAPDWFGLECTSTSGDSRAFRLLAGPAQGGG